MAPSIDDLRAAVVEFSRYGQAERSWVALLTATSPQLNPASAAHRRALLVWLNAWGCRIRYPRAGEPDMFGPGVARWWRVWRHRVPSSEAALVELTDEATAVMGHCYAELAGMPVSAGDRPRSLGPTAAAKLLHALRPRALMPWDAAIAQSLHGARDAAAYADHQRLGRDWASRLLDQAGVDEATLAAMYGQPGRTLAKMLDDYCYLVFTRDAQ